MRSHPPPPFPSRSLRSPPTSPFPFLLAQPPSPPFPPPTRLLLFHFYPFRSHVPPPFTPSRAKPEVLARCLTKPPSSHRPALLLVLYHPSPLQRPSPPPPRPNRLYPSSTHRLSRPSTPSKSYTRAGLQGIVNCSCSANLHKSILNQPSSPRRVRRLAAADPTTRRMCTGAPAPIVTPATRCVPLHEHAGVFRFLRFRVTNWSFPSNDHN